MCVSPFHHSANKWQYVTVISTVPSQEGRGCYCVFSCLRGLSPGTSASSQNLKACIRKTGELAELKWINYSIKIKTMKTTDQTCELSKPSQKVKQEQ